MRYKISTVNDHYQLKKDRDRLEKLGFTFELYKDWYWIRGEPEITINTIDELNEFIHTHGEIIMDKGTIKIFDGYL